MIRVPAMALALTFAAGPGLAEEPENYIKYRQLMMKAIGGHMGAASQILRGLVAPEGDLQVHAQSLAALTTNIPRLFPEGSDFGETEALPAIWDDRAKFEEAAEAAKTATSAFAEAVAGGDMETIAAAHREVGKSCKGCHESFRKED
jgi:cytochrome c556